MNVEKNGYIYLIPKQDDENIKMCSDRAWYIANELPKKTIDFNKLNRMSLFYRNIKHLNVCYQNEIQNQINNHKYIELL